MWPLRKKTKTILTILFFTSLSFSQNFDRLSTMYNEKKFEQVIEEISPLLKTDKEPSAELLSLLGRAYVDIGKPEEAIPHLRNVIEPSSNVPNWMNAWSLYYMSKAFSRIGELDSASKYLHKTIETNATKNVVKSARMDLVNLGLSPTFGKWNRKETNNFIFHFPKNTKVKDIDAFAKNRQEAFDSINIFFEAKLPKKIDFYVWNKTIDYDKRNKRPSGFAIPELSIVHSRYFQTRGHEMTHVISYFSVDSKVRTSFINEGIATYFDLSNRDKMDMAKIARKDCDIPIIKMWKRNEVFRSIEQDKAYSLAAAFVGKLINEEGKDKFMQLLSNQTYESALTVYGEKLGTIIQALEKDLKS